MKMKMKRIIKTIFLFNVLVFSYDAISQTSNRSVDDPIAESYLAMMSLKGGETFGSSSNSTNYLASDGSIIWLTNSKYQTDIEVIGRDDYIGFYQEKSKSTNNDAIIIKVNNTISKNNLNNKNINNLAFLAWGNNNDDNGIIEIYTKDIPSTDILERLDREWKVMNSGIDWVSLSISLVDINYSGTHISDFELLIDEGDGDFTKGNIQRIKADYINADIVYFKKLNFRSGQVFTLATNIEHRPEIVFSQDLSINAGSNYNKTFLITDLDEDAVSSFATRIPSWLSFVDNNNGTFTLKGKPSYSDIGSNKLNIQLNDGKQTIDYPIVLTVLRSKTRDTEYLKSRTSFTKNSRIKEQFDDVEEKPDGHIFSNSSDLELSFDGWLKQNGNQTIGLRFSKLNIPQGAIITSAFIQFTSSDNNGTGTSNIIIQGEASNNSKQFEIYKNNVSKRERTSSRVLWSPAEWTTAFEAGPKQKTADLKNIVQEIVSRLGYDRNSAISFIISGTGNRTAQSQKSNNGSHAPLLTVEYIMPTLSSN